jgi:hypothetical protein
LVSISTSDFTRWRCQLPEAPWTFTLFWTSMCGYSVMRSLEFDLHDLLFRRCAGVPIMGESRLQMGKAHASFALGCTALQLFNYSFSFISYGDVPCSHAWRMAAVTSPMDER